MADLSKHPAIVIVPLVISLIALGVGIYSLVHSIGVESEQREVDVEVEASTSRSTRSESAGLILKASIANESLRSIIVRRASLWAGDQPLSFDTGYSEPEPGAERSQFPLTLEAREGRTIRLFMGEGFLVGACLEGEPVYPIRASRQRKCRLWRAALSRGSPRERLKLRLRLAPGGVRDYPVRLEPPRPNLIGAGWGMGVKFGRQLALTLEHDGTGPPAGTVRLDLWRSGDHEFHRSFQRPLVPASLAPWAPRKSLFPLPPLERGRYEYVFHVEGQAVWAGCLRVPSGSLSCH